MKGEPYLLLPRQKSCGLYRLLAALPTDLPNSSPIREAKERKRITQEAFLLAANRGIGSDVTGFCNKENGVMRWQTVQALSIVLFLTVAAQTVEAKPKYIGVAKCANCHKANYLAWKTSSHAKTFNVLKPGKRKKAKLRAELDPEKDYTTDKKCVRCHVTGYRKKGGFKDIESTPQMAGVGCESCHGPGSKYAVLHDKKMYGFEKREATELGQLYGADDEAVCLQCHLHKDSPFHEKLDEKYKWDWKEKLKVRKAYHPKSKGKSQFSF